MKRECAANPSLDDEVVLSLQGLAVSAGERDLIVGLGLQVRAGEMVALLGSSGCGKSTLLRATSGLIDPSGGEVVFRGRAPSEWGWPRYRRQAPYVEQTPVMLAGTVSDNLARPFSYRAAQTAFSEERALALLSRLGLTDSIMSRVARSLSVGEQQRVALARALLIEPRLLLLDEPTSALDGDAVFLVEEVLREEARDRGLAALIVTHDHEQARRLGDRRIDLKPYCQCLEDSPT